MWILKEKTYSSIVPRKKVGMETPIRLKTVKARSSALYCRRALIMPMGMPISSSKMIPKRAIITVAGNRCRIDCVTGSWFTYE